MQILNLYHKRLTFEEKNFAFSIDAGEIKTVLNDIGEFLIKNRWIVKVGKTAKIGQANKANGRTNINHRNRSKKIT